MPLSLHSIDNMSYQKITCLRLNLPGIFNDLQLFALGQRIDSNTTPNIISVLFPSNLINTILVDLSLLN